MIRDVQKKLNVYGIQISSHEVTTLPVSIGALWSYLSTQKDIFQHLKLQGISISYEKSVLEIIDDIKRTKGIPQIILISVYMWNRNRSNKLTKAIKNQWPDVKIIAGGNDIPERVDRLRKFAEENRQYDYLVIGEGELPLENIIRFELKKRGILYSQYENTSFCFYENKQFISYKKRQYLSHKQELDLPSPAEMGLYNEFADKHKNAELMGVVETNRGCPYSCTFCDWGLQEKLRKFSMKRIYKDISWMMQNVDDILISDANFGILDRDIDIANYICDTARFGKNIQSHSVNVTYSKVKKENVLNIAKVLSKNDLNRSGASFSLQSLHKPTLKAVKRSNMEIYNQMDWITKNFTKNGIPFYSEFILGLPEETKESFLAGLDLIFKYNPFEFHIHKLVSLENSELIKNDHISKYNMKFEKSVVGLSDYEDEREISNIIRSTSTMTNEDIKYISTIRDYIQLMYLGKILYYTQYFLVNEYGISLVKMYEFLLDYSIKSKDPFWVQVYKNFRTKERYYNPNIKRPFHRMTNAWIFLGWTPENKTTFYQKINVFLKKFYPKLDAKILEDILYFNANMILDKSAYVEKEFSTRYNWIKYFLCGDLIDEKTTYKVWTCKLGVPKVHPKNMNQEEIVFYASGGHQYIFNKQNAFVFQEGIAFAKDFRKEFIHRTGLFFDKKSYQRDNNYKQIASPYKVLEA